jgi:hypothetical protein
MILPKKKMEGLHARCECFVELVKEVSHSPAKLEQDPDLYRVAQYLNCKSLRQCSEQSAMIWVFI